MLEIRNWLQRPRSVPLSSTHSEIVAFINNFSDWLLSGGYSEILNASGIPGGTRTPKNSIWQASSHKSGLPGPRRPPPNSRDHRLVFIERFNFSKRGKLGGLRAGSRYSNRQRSSSVPDWKDRDQDLSRIDHASVTTLLSILPLIFTHYKRIGNGILVIDYNRYMRRSCKRKLKRRLIKEDIAFENHLQYPTCILASLSCT